MGKEKSAVLEPSILDAYYANNAKKLHKTVDKILCKFGGLSDKDRDDFYSLANEVFVDVMKRYDSSQPLMDSYIPVWLTRSRRRSQEGTGKNAKRTECLSH